nr:PREDICTED: serine/threonine-protein phosphatase 5-like [Bemisia tabaci]
MASVKSYLIKSFFNPVPFCSAKKSGRIYSTFRQILLVGQLASLVVSSTGDKGSVRGILDAVDPNALNIDTDYVGPKLDNVTLTFMKNLIQFYNKTLYEDKNNILHQKFVLMILKQTRDHFKTQPSLQEVELKPAEKITVCGNIHGKLEDLLHIFDINGFPSPSNRYLFNGGFINRRPESIECALILFGFALLYPDSFFINRGSHEDFHQSQGKGSLTEESDRKYPGNSVEVLHGFWEVFRWLPLALIIRGNVLKKVDSSWSGTNLIRPIIWGRKMYNRFTGQRKIGAYAPSHGRILVVHAGLFSKPGVTLDDIQRIERGCDPEDSALMFDMLWSNPGEKDGRHQNIPGFGSIQFGPDISESFCTRNKIDYIIRSHAPVPMGYHVEHNGRVVTIFSTTDCHRDNRGAIAVVKAPELKPVFTVFAFKYDYKEARCLWLGEKNISVEKYNTIGVEQTEGSPLG